jgi:hypothetical protein
VGVLVTVGVGNSTIKSHGHGILKSQYMENPEKYRLYDPS